MYCTHCVKTLASTLLLTAIAVAAGCGQPSTPPPGAPDKAASPSVEKGKEATSAAETAAEEPANETPETETAATADFSGEWGTLSGRIVFDGPVPKPQPVDTAKDPNCKEKLTSETLVVGPDGGLANAVVMLRTKGVPVNPEYEKTAADKVDLTNKNCRFDPHVQIVRLSQEVLLKNDDPTGHNTNITTFKNTNINPILAVGTDPIPYKFTAEESVPVKVSCNIHPWMGAWLVPRTDPYAAVTDADGNFTIKDLPAGSELEFRLWQESAGYLKNATFKGGKSDSRGGFKIKIKPGENNLGDIKVSSSIFK